MRLIKIGRDPSCNIVLNSQKVSSLHAEITLLNSGDITLEDKGSRNGTFVMNQPITPGKAVNIRRGDAVRFGDVELQWSQIPQPENLTAYKGVYGIGSHFNNDFQISGSTVSRYHATIYHGRDGKFFIKDHSKNGTTVNGQRLIGDNMMRIKRKDAIVCGGVPIDLNRLPWPKPVGKYIAIAAATVAIVAGLGFGIYMLLNGRGGCQLSDEELYARYNNSVVLLLGRYHYEIVEYSDVLNSLGIPTKYYVKEDPISGEHTFDPASDNPFEEQSQALRSSFQATGFFISDDGKLITNLHVTRPWLFEDVNKQIRSHVKDEILKKIQEYEEGKLDEQTTLAFVKALNALLNSNTLDFSDAIDEESQTLSQMEDKIKAVKKIVEEFKVDGICDKILLVPQGKYFSDENAIVCTELYSGENPNPEIDIALVKSDKGELPSHCRYINIVDSMVTGKHDYVVGSKIYTIGFPGGTNTQDNLEKMLLQVYGHEGTITKLQDDRRFAISANSAPGASGSPVFDDCGMLIGVLNSRYKAAPSINLSVKTKYIRDLLDNYENR